ncbi:MAG TPA: hypothetical protein VE954_33255 [Oligoflexus sp.]|uniref:hypothetical protein n=1 Tax=Oligoflexus sp. TaxID=1971216 RepID=UPI002D52C6D8|nr:hypothetical protein [Oligoflexus sp.]HYX37995.1 hypothetical protein [Oligoflexus sp.]
MKTLGFLVAGITVAMCALVTDAKACSVRPVDLVEQTSDMQRFVTTALNLDPAEIISVDAGHVSGDYIWSDPMCPEGRTASATFTVRFKNSMEPLASNCVSVVKVSRTEPTGFSKIPVKHRISIEITQEKCQR